MIVRFGDEAIVDTGEFPVDAENLRWSYTRVGGRFGIEYPAIGIRDEFVSVLKSLRWCVVGREPEKDVVECVGDIEDDVTVRILVASGNVSVETWAQGLVFKSRDSS